MNRNKILKVINPILGLLLVNQIVTGILGESLPEELFEILHEGGGYAFAATAVLHVILNWNWVKANMFPGRTSPKAETMSPLK